MSDDASLDLASRIDRLEAQEAMVIISAAILCERDPSVRGLIDAALQAYETEARRLHSAGLSTATRNLRQCLLAELAARSA